MSRVRSIYFTETEWEAITALALARDTAFNTIVRVALRALLGLPNPSWADELIKEHTAA